MAYQLWISYEQMKHFFVTRNEPMNRALQSSFAATASAGLLLYLWRLAFDSTDWAVLALVPLAIVIARGIWPLTLDPWRAKLNLALREESVLQYYLTGKIRAAFLSILFTFAAVFLLAWLALNISIHQSAIILAAFFLAASLYSWGQHLLSHHLHQPFARVFATSVVTWLVAVPLTIIIARWTWSIALMPGAILDASFQDAVQIGLNELPARGGWIADLLALPNAYAAAKLWAVVQLRDYQIVSVLFSIDAALFSFVLCRSAIIISQFIDLYIIKASEE